MTKICGIYLITHIATGRKYVGQSIDIHKRWREHSRSKSGGILAHAISKYGWISFSAEIVQICSPDDLDNMEIHVIHQHNCISPNGFNLATGGGHSLHHAESIAKMSLSQTGVMHSEETKAKISKSCKARMTDEERMHLSETLKGRPRNPDAVAKTAAAHAGMKRSEATKAKMAAAKLGKKQTAEHIAARLATRKLSPPNPPRPFSQEHRANISKSGAGRVFAPEVIAKRVETWKKNQLLRQNVATPAAGDLLP